MQAVGRRFDSAQLHQLRDDESGAESADETALQLKWVRDLAVPEPWEMVGGLFDPRRSRSLTRESGKQNDSRFRYFMVKLLRVDGGCLGAEKR